MIDAIGEAVYLIVGMIVWIGGPLVIGAALIWFACYLFARLTAEVEVEDLRSQLDCGVGAMGDPCKREMGPSCAVCRTRSLLAERDHQDAEIARLDAIIEELRKGKP